LRDFAYAQFSFDSLGGFMSTPRFAAHAAAIVLTSVSALCFAQAQKADPAAVSPAPANGPIVKVRQGEAQGIVADGVAIF
jgi:hypothetical protein